MMFEPNEGQTVSFSPNYRMRVDLEECLENFDSLWDLNDERMQKRIFNPWRGMHSLRKINWERKEDVKVMVVKLLVKL